MTFLKSVWFHLALCVSRCRCVRGSAQRCRGAPPVSSHAVPLLPLMEDWRMEEWEEVGATPPRTLKLATATFPSAHFRPPPLLPLHPRPPPHLLMAAVDWVFMLICPTAQTHPPAACIIMKTARRKVLMLLNI